MTFEEWCEIVFDENSILFDRKLDSPDKVRIAKYWAKCAWNNQQKEIAKLEKRLAELSEDIELFFKNEDMLSKL